MDLNPETIRVISSRICAEAHTQTEEIFGGKRSAFSFEVSLLKEIKILCKCVDHLLEHIEGSSEATEVSENGDQEGDEV